MVLKTQDALEEWEVARYLAAALDAGQRRVLVLARLEMTTLQLLEPLPQRRIAGQTRSERQRVDEQADDRFHAGQVRRTARHVEPVHDLVVAAIGAEHERPESLHHRVDRDAVRCRALAQRAGRRGRNRGVLEDLRLVTIDP